MNIKSIKYKCQDKEYFCIKVTKENEYRLFKEFGKDNISFYTDKMIIKINREDFTVFYGEYIIYNLVYINGELAGIEIKDILSEEQIINCKYIEYKE